jgi:DUF4097 and DUF4098 domain-containing protein YvlB
MTFTYSGDPTTSTRNKVRFLINDTTATDVLFSDEELDYLITEWGTNVYEISRAACETLVSRFSRLADSTSKSVGDISVSQSFTAKSKQYQDLANSFLDRKMRKSPPTMTANANSLLSTDDRNVTDFNTDFYAGIHDNPNSNYEQRVLE